MSSDSTPIEAAAHDFDFFVGNWSVTHRRLAHRLVGNTEWVEFGGTTTMRLMLGGLGNIDENVIDLPSGAYQAVTMRLFNPAAARWSIWWVDARDPNLGAPVHGTFTDGVGRFFGEDVLDGRPINVRFIWSAITSRSAHWEQAFSADDGKTWETNWTMAFERIASAAD